MKLLDELIIARNNEKKNDFTIDFNFAFYKDFSAHKKTL